MARRYEDEGGEVRGNGSTKGGLTAITISQLPYKGLSILPNDDGEIGNIIPREINNPIWSLSEFLIRQDHPGDTGLLDHLIPMVNKVILPGTKYTSLELGDMIDYDNDSFVARGITMHSESFIDKVYLITSLVVKEDGIVINKTIEVNQNSLGTPFDIADDYPNPFN